MTEIAHIMIRTSESALLPFAHIMTQPSSHSSSRADRDRTYYDSDLRFRNVRYLLEYIITTINIIASITTINRIASITTINRIASITTINRSFGQPTLRRRDEKDDDRTETNPNP